MSTNDDVHPRALVQLHQPGAPDNLDAPAARLVSRFLANRSPATRRSYAGDLAAFARWADRRTPEEAAGLLLGCTAGRAAELASAFREHMEGRGLAPASIARRLACLRSLTATARKLKLTAWVLDVETPRVETLRDCRGPGLAGFEKMLGLLAGRRDAKGARDRALLHLLFNPALRRSEAAGLDVRHVDLQGGRMSIKGKGRTGRETVPLEGPAREAVAEWLRV